MKFLAIFAFAIISSAIYAFKGMPTLFAQKQKIVKNDTLNKQKVDSLAALKSMKVKLHKKNAHASYYANKFNGRRTASGRRFSNDGYTAAHRKFPFGTKLRITNEANNKSVIVEVTDRGPFTRGREIDLTRRAFEDISSHSYKGSIKVTIEEIK